MSDIAPSSHPQPRIGILRSTRRRHMAAVCGQLGAQKVSVRAVQRLTGGSYRDVSAVVKLWRQRHEEISTLISDTDSRESLQAIGELVWAAVDQMREDFVAIATAETMAPRLQQLENLLTEIHRDLRNRQVAVTHQFQAMSDRIAVLGRRLEEAQAVSPVLQAPDPTLQQLRGELAEVVTRLTTWRSATSHEIGVHLTPVQKALTALDQRLEGVGDMSTPAQGPSDVHTMLKPIEHQLEAMGEALARLSQQMTRPNRKRRTAPKRLARPSRTISRRVQAKRQKERNRRTFDLSNSARPRAKQGTTRNHPTSRRRTALQKTRNATVLPRSNKKVRRSSRVAGRKQVKSKR